MLLYHTSDWLNQQNLPKLQVDVYLFILNWSTIFLSTKLLLSLNTTVVLCGEHWKIGRFFYGLCLQLFWKLQKICTWMVKKYPCEQLNNKLNATNLRHNKHPNNYLEEIHFLLLRPPPSPGPGISYICMVILTRSLRRESSTIFLWEQKLFFLTISSAV